MFLTSFIATFVLFSHFSRHLFDIPCVQGPDQAPWFRTCVYAKIAIYDLRPEGFELLDRTKHPMFLHTQKLFLSESSLGKILDLEWTNLLKSKFCQHGKRFFLWKWCTSSPVDHDFRYNAMVQLKNSESHLRRRLVPAPGVMRRPFSVYTVLWWEIEGNPCSYSP